MKRSTALLFGMAFLASINSSLAQQVGRSRAENGEPGLRPTDGSHIVSISGACTGVGVVANSNGNLQPTVTVGGRVTVVSAGPVGESGQVVRNIEGRGAVGLDSRGGLVLAGSSRLGGGYAFTRNPVSPYVGGAVSVANFNVAGPIEVAERPVAPTPGVTPALANRTLQVGPALVESGVLISSPNRRILLTAQGGVSLSEGMITDHTSPTNFAYNTPASGPAGVVGVRGVFTMAPELVAAIDALHSRRFDGVSNTTVVRGHVEWMPLNRVPLGVFMDASVNTTAVTDSRNPAPAIEVEASANAGILFTFEDRAYSGVRDTQAASAEQ